MRILSYSRGLLERALQRMQDEQYRRAEVAAASAGSASVFLEEDPETPPPVRASAQAVTRQIERLLGEIWDFQIGQYGERFLSGQRRPNKEVAQREAALFVSDLRDSAKEANRID